MQDIREIAYFKMGRVWGYERQVCQRFLIFEWEYSALDGWWTSCGTSFSLASLVTYGHSHEQRQRSRHEHGHALCRRQDNRRGV
jgi:hypothetical protein